MREIDLNDLSYAAKMKSDLMYLLWRLEQENLPNQKIFKEELRVIVGEFIEFESNLQESFLAKSNN
ncbi:hypothetical protein [Paenibacillus sp. IHBB 3054]|uniref:hypothetical protein n=1 Tax=Paenibacillus sp. IHBB 3054 TaxID=3425689 RepID=UPI003F673A35